MNINAREYIKNNFKDDNIDDIQSSIEESIKSDDEVILIGLGVLFELVWKKSNKDQRKMILTSIKESL